MRAIGYWNSQNGKGNATFKKEIFPDIVSSIRHPMHVVFEPGQRRLGVAVGGVITSFAEGEGLPLIASIPATYPEWLGDRSFLEIHKLRFAYVGGAMAKGIASAKMVMELAAIGMLGFLGSAGMKFPQLEENIQLLSGTLDPLGRSWGVSMIHKPANPDYEEKLVDLILNYGVRRISAAAFLGVTPALVRYAVNGLSEDEFGRVKRKNYVFAKISHPEIAKHFLAPPPEEILSQLVANRSVTAREAALAQKIPIAEVLDIEADSGGHTDNRPLNALFSVIANLRDEMSDLYGYKQKIYLGAAGGIGTPQAVAAAFALGASHIVVGSVHQCALEAGTSQEVKDLLAKASMADVMMTSCSDMFEMGVKVQVLKRGTMMGTRGNLLYDLYKKFDSWESIPDVIRQDLERNVFRMSFERVWEETKKYFERTDPARIPLGENNPKYKLASIFKWYLGNSSRWAIEGKKERLIDFQIWCGPAMGAFNQWVKGSFLEALANRSVKQIALNLMEGGAVCARIQQLRTYGLAIEQSDVSIRPEPLSV